MKLTVFLMFSVLLILNVGTAASNGEKESKEELTYTEDIQAITDNLLDTFIFKVSIKKNDVIKKMYVLFLLNSFIRCSLYNNF